MTNKRKKICILIVIICVIALSVSFIYLKTQKNYNVAKNDALFDSNLAIMLETGNDTKNYQNSKDISFPTKGYTYNSEKSYCLNGSPITWDEVNHKITTIVSGSEKCYIYFDKNPVFAETILTNNGGATAIQAKGTPNFATAATTDEGMYAATDDYGTSYYFRGAVSNNWVKFAGMYWRIVRINGNNTVKLIYSGTTAPTETQKVVMTGTGTQIGTSVFNTNYNSAEYLGYKYTIGETHGLNVDSSAKTTIDNWYKNNLLSQSSNIADTIYCADRSTYSGMVAGSNYNGTGVGTTTTWYGAVKRLVSSTSWAINPTAAPILTCPNKSDAFTVNDSTNGNASLTYPISMLTADELAMAGGLYGTGNTSFYLYNNQIYWTISPMCMHSDNKAYEYVLYSGGSFTGDYLTQNYGLRGVISLISNTEVTGSGNWNDPYILK